MEDLMKPLRRLTQEKNRTLRITRNEIEDEFEREKYAKIWFR